MRPLGSAVSEELADFGRQPTRASRAKAEWLWCLTSINESIPLRPAYASQGKHYVKSKVRSGVIDCVKWLRVSFARDGCVCSQTSVHLHLLSRCRTTVISRCWAAKRLLETTTSQPGYDVFLFFAMVFMSPLNVLDSSFLLLLK